MIGKQLKKERKGQNLSYVNFSKLTGLSVPTLIAVEKDQNCNIETLRTYAKSLGKKLVIGLE